MAVKESGEMACLLSSERAPLSQTSLSSCWLAKNGRASCANNDSLCVREDGCDGEAAWTLDVHEKGSWNRDKGLQGELVLIIPSELESVYCKAYLELVFASLSGWGGV